MFNFLKTLSTAILISSTFTWISDTNTFTNKIEGILRSIIISKDFLNILDDESKINTIKNLIKPTGNDNEMNKNIEEYYQVYVEKMLSVSQVNVRSNYDVDARIFFDKEKKLIACDRTIKYKLYPSYNGFEDS